MTFLALLALKMATGSFPVDGSEGSREPWFTLENDPAPGRAVEEDVWRPFPHLRYEDWGAPPAESRGRAGHSGRPEAEPFAWRDTAPPEPLKFRSLLDPLETLVDFKHLRGSWDRRTSEVSFGTDLSTLANSLGAPLSAGVFLGICVDLLEFPERDGGRLPLLGTRRGALRASDACTGFGLTLGF